MLSLPGKGNIKVILAKQSQFFLKFKKPGHIYALCRSIFDKANSVAQVFSLRVPEALVVRKMRATPGLLPANGNLK